MTASGAAAACRSAPTGFPTGTLTASAAALAFFSAASFSGCSLCRLVMATWCHAAASCGTERRACGLCATKAH